MTDEQKAAFIISQAACMIAEIEGMKAENKLQEYNGEDPAFVKSDFEGVSAKYACLWHNQVIEFFQG